MRSPACMVLIFTRWASKEDFEHWRTGMGEAAHKREAAHGQPAASGSELWTFDVVLDVAPAPASA